MTKKQMLNFEFVLLGSFSSQYAFFATAYQTSYP